LWRRRFLADKLCAKSVWANSGDEGQSENQLHFCHETSNHGSGPSRAELGSISTIIDARGRRKRCPGRVIDSHGEEQRITRKRRGRGGFATDKRDSLTECVGGL
jgi:hypothetical protein